MMAGASGGGGETKSDPSGWTVDTLHALIEQRFAAMDRTLQEMDRRYEQRFASQEKAIAEKDAATKDRFESVNEFRAQSLDQAARFMPRLEAEQRTQQNAERIDALERRHTTDIAQINSRLDLAAGRGIGVEKGWGYLIAAAGLVATVIAIIYALNK
jgi:hypothetical protein